jgi:hypothetical protein
MISICLTDDTGANADTKSKGLDGRGLANLFGFLAGKRSRPNRAGPTGDLHQPRPVRLDRCSSRACIECCKRFMVVARIWCSSMASTAPAVPAPDPACPVSNLTLAAASDIFWAARRLVRLSSGLLDISRCLVVAVSPHAVCETVVKGFRLVGGRADSSRSVEVRPGAGSHLSGLTGIDRSHTTPGPESTAQG